MAYADAQSSQQKAAGIAGAALAHVAIGGLILTGLTVTNVIPPIIDTGQMKPIDYTPKPPPPPPEPAPEPKAETPPVEKPVFVPDPPVSLTNEQPFTRTIPDIPPPGPIERIIPSPRPDPAPDFGALQPIAAVPRNDASRWITDRDYKPRWIREGKYGRASFTLDINAEGRVEKCSITRSTGHSVLDQATCSLITKRARFKPAQASDGSATTGVYSSSIRWVVPE